MKFDPEVKKDMGFMAVGCGVCSAVVALVFAVIGRFDLPVLWGVLIGYVLSFGNFALMSIGILKALETGDEVTAKLKMRRSYVFRTVVMLAVMGVSIAVEYVNWIPVVASVFYPRIIITARGLWRKYKTRNDPPPEYDPVPEDEEEEKTDEFEKFVSGFAKGEVPKAPVSESPAKKNDNDNKEDKN